MRLLDHGTGIEIWISARETRDWAHKIGAAWPCSTLEGHRIFAAFDSNGLLDMAIDGRDGFNDDVDGIDGNEFSAIMADHIETRIDKDHDLYFVTVGQFR